jgi:hypothetical protein
MELPEVGLRCGVRIDIGIAFWKHDENCPGTENPNGSLDQLPEITAGFGAPVDPWLVFIVLANLFAAQDYRPVCQ